MNLWSDAALTWQHPGGEDDLVIQMIVILMPTAANKQLLQVNGKSPYWSETVKPTRTRLNIPHVFVVLGQKSIRYMSLSSSPRHLRAPAVQFAMKSWKPTSDWGTTPWQRGWSPPPCDRRLWPWSTRALRWPLHWARSLPRSAAVGTAVILIGHE